MCIYMLCCIIHTYNIIYKCTHPSLEAAARSSSRPSCSLKLSQSIADLVTVDITFGPFKVSNTASKDDTATSFEILEFLYNHELRAVYFQSSFF